MTDPTPAGAADLDPVAALNSLAEPSRRVLYDYIAKQTDWVGRAEAAEATGLQLAITAHHLDRLAEDGLLDVHYRRLSGRGGPGAGRPSKLYRRAQNDIQVTMPPRDYQLAGRILADAVAASQATGLDVGRAVESAAREAGRLLGEEMRERLARDDSDRDALRVVLAMLDEQGFEPVHRDDGTIVLRNCPFHLLAGRQPELVCGMNHHLITAALDELGDDHATHLGFDAFLVPDPEVCCVRLQRSDG